MKKIFYAAVLIASIVSLSSCSDKKDDPEPTPTPTPTPPTLSINSPYQVYFKLNGTAVSYVNGVTAGFDMSNSSDNSIAPLGGGTSTFIYGSDIGNGSSYIGFSKGTITLPGGGLCSESQFLALFATGTVPYSTGAASGVFVTYFDGTDTYRSDYGTANQAGSAFKIEARQEVSGSYYTVKVYVTYNCKVYNSSGASKTITDGSFIMNFSKI